MGSSNKKRGIEHWQWIMIYLAIYDVIAVSFAYFTASFVNKDDIYMDMYKKIEVDG